MNILSETEAFCQKLMVLSNTLPKDFKMKLEVSKDLLDQFSNELYEKYKRLHGIHMEEMDLSITKKVTFNSIFSPETGNLRIEELKDSK